MFNNSKVWGSCPIGTNFGSRLRLHLGMDMAKYKSLVNTPGGISGQGLGCHKVKVWGSFQTAGPIDTKCGTHVEHICRSIWEWIYAKQISPRDTRGGGTGGGGGLGVKHSKVLGSCQTAGPIGTNFGSRLQIHLGMNIG